MWKKCTSSMSSSRSTTSTSSLYRLYKSLQSLHVTLLFSKQIFATVQKNDFGQKYELPKGKNILNVTNCIQTDNNLRTRYIFKRFGKRSPVGALCRLRSPAWLPPGRLSQRWQNSAEKRGHQPIVGSLRAGCTGSLAPAGRSAGPHQGWAWSSM